AGATMYLCLRLLIPPYGDASPIDPPAALAGALAFEFSDLFIVHFGNLNMIAVAAWLPLVVLLFHRSLTQASYGLAAASGGVLAVATLAGHIQITLFMLLALGLDALWHLQFSISGLRRAIFREKNWNFGTFRAIPPYIGATGRSPLRDIESPPEIPNQPSAFSLQPLLALLIMLIITLGLSALLLFPAFELSRYTPRAGLTYPEAARYSLHPVQLVGLLIPNYFGRDPAQHWGPWERVETGYIGLITLMLALIGALVYPGRLKGFLVGLGLVALLLAMGGYTVLHGWLYATTPGFDQLRAPARFILLLDFSLATLAAMGLNQLLRQPFDEKTRTLLPKLLKTLTWSLGGLLVIATPLSYYAMIVTQDRNPAIFNRAVAAASGVATFAFFTIAALVILHLINNQWLREWRAGVAVSALILLDLFTLGSGVDVGHNRPVSGFDHPEALAFLQTDPGLYRIEVATDVWHLWQPNTALLYGLDDVWGLYNPLTLADTTLYWEGAPPRRSGRYNFLGVKYIIAGKAGAPADGHIIPVFDADPAINIYLNQAALARVLFVGEAQIVPNHDAAWDAIRGDDFDPATTVILENDQPPHSQPVTPVNTHPASTLAILQYGTGAVTIAVDADQSGYLVLPDAYYPGWQATVDGRPEPIRRANYAFRAVYVPAGRHTVHFVFDPPIWKIGLGVSGLTLLVLVIWSGWRLAT
ncbi:MAG: YfhO family protein, partial [Chloroflexota bacterium]